MLVELRVQDLGVIETSPSTSGPGMTALTGETGAGKTLLVEALELLVGGRADPVPRAPRRRPGAGRGPVRRRHRCDRRRGDQRGGPGTRSSWPAVKGGRSGPGSTAAWRRSSALAEAAGGWSTSTASTPISRCSTPPPSAGPSTSSARRSGPLAAARPPAAPARRRARGPGRRRPGPGARDRPAALPARRDRRRRTRRRRRGRASWRPRRTAWPRPPPTVEAGRRRPRRAVAGMPTEASAVDRSARPPGPWPAAPRWRRLEPGSRSPWPTPPTWPPSSARSSRPGRTTPNAWRRSAPAATCSTSCGGSTARASPACWPTPRRPGSAWPTSRRSRNSGPPRSRPRSPRPEPRRPSAEAGGGGPGGEAAPRLAAADRGTLRTLAMPRPAST